MAQHMVKELQFICPPMVWQNGTVLELANLHDRVADGSMHMGVHIQLLHLRNGRDCLMFTLQGSMKMTVTEITTGKFGNGNTD
jgi:hypothetical protein